MEKEKEVNKKKSLEDRIWERDNEKLLSMNNSSSKLLYSSIILLNCFSRIRHNEMG